MCSDITSKNSNNNTSSSTSRTVGSFDRWLVDDLSNPCIDACNGDDDDDDGDDDDASFLGLVR